MLHHEQSDTASPPLGCPLSPSQLPLSPQAWVPLQRQGFGNRQELTVLRRWTPHPGSAGGSSFDDHHPLTINVDVQFGGDNGALL